MRWVVKAAVAKLLSITPGGRQVHRLAQRYVTRSLPLPEHDFLSRAAAACNHVQSYRQFGDRRPLAEATFLEFGAGWDLTIPLVLRAAGVGRQVLFDLEALASGDLVGLSLQRLRRIIDDPPREFNGRSVTLDGALLPSSGPTRREPLQSWLARLAICYRAPADAADTGLAGNSIDCATSTVTLEHVPEGDILRIFREMWRVLQPGGILSCDIDLSDHFSHSDPTLTPWHFLRFDERTWELVNSPLLYQNRLRASTYVTLAESTGFHIRQATPTVRSLSEAGVLPQPQVHPSLVRWQDQRDLLATALHLVCLKPL